MGHIMVGKKGTSDAQNVIFHQQFITQISRETKRALVDQNTACTDRSATQIIEK